MTLRLVLRGLLRRPAFTLSAVVPLALALGATTTLYRVTREVVLEPRALLQSDDLYVLWETSVRRDGVMSEMSFPDFLDWREQASSFEDMAAMGAMNWAWSEGGDVVRDVPYRAVSWSFFDVMGVEAAMGRTFVAEDEQPDADRVVVLSHAFWQTRLGGVRDVVGQTLLLGANGDTRHTIVGVMPPEFRFPRSAQLWTPVRPILADYDGLGRNLFILFAVARLDEQVSVEQADTELSAVVRRLSRDEHPSRRRWSEWRAVMTPLEGFELGSTPLGLGALSGAAASLLLISGLSVGGLVLARAMARRHELAIVSAIGAGSYVIALRTALEAAVIVFVGCIGAIGVSIVATPIVLARLPLAAGMEDVFAWGASDTLLLVGMGAIATLLVALPASLSVRPTPIVRDIATALSKRSALQGWQRPLIVTATAIAMILSAAAVLLVRSYVELTRADLGFRPARVLSVHVSHPEGTSKRAQRQFVRELIERARSLDAVTGAAAVSPRPLMYGAVGDDAPFIYEGQTMSERDNNPTANHVVVSPGYFDVMGIRLVAGRSFDVGDRETSSRVVVIGESLARYAWPHETVERAVGKRMWFGVRDDASEPIWYTVVGVVADARYRGITASRLDLYVTFEQSDDQPPGLVIKTRSDPYALVPAVRDQVRAIDASLDIEHVTSMSDVVADEMAPWRFNMLVASAFAAFALVLSGLGLFGVVAYTASQRTREMGIRSAVGATPAHIRRLLTGEALSLVVIGVAFGTAAAFAASKFLASLLYGVTERDLGSFAVASAVLFGCGFIACYLPARAAARVSPLEALRTE